MGQIEDISIGFWLDKTYLDNNKFGKVLETSLHELCHKAGGDGTESFGYKLTNVNANVLKQILGNPKTRSELCALNKLWDECTTSIGQMEAT